MITFDTKQLNKNLQDIAFAIRTQIRVNTRRGVDIDGNAFAPYSASYAKAKADYMGTKGKKTAKSGKSVTWSTNRVNLMLTGVMMDSIAVSREGDHYVIYVADANRKLIALYHHTGKGNNPERPFFGISKANEKAIFAKYMNRPLLKKAIK
jgi:hypothetical protein